MKQSRNFDLIQKNTADMIDLWMYNFARNANDFLNGNSVRRLNVFKDKSIKNHKSKNSAIVIGAGPSVKNNNHLELLSKSHYKAQLSVLIECLSPVLKMALLQKNFQNFMF